MYPVNIFINSMFKSPIRTLAWPVFSAFFVVLHPFGAEAQDTVRAAEAGNGLQHGSATVNDSAIEDRSHIPKTGNPLLPDSLWIYLKSQAFNRTLDRAIAYQKKADSLNRVSIQWRKEAARMDDPITRGRLQKRIETVEDSVAMLRMLADEYFAIMNAGMPGEAEGGKVHPYLVRDTVLSGITVYRYNLTPEFMAELDRIRAPAVSSGTQETMAGEETGKEGPSETGKDRTGKEGTGISEKPEPVSDKAAADKAGIPAEFAILDTSPYGQGSPVERDYTIPPGVFYRIQLAVYSRELPADHFGGLAPITTEIIPGRGLTRYFVGKFTRMEKARAALVKVRALGYPDAFIIGYYNGQKSSFSKLRALEK
jgi:hypothetical protein